uniref:OV-16 antigen n=1 Tax=Aceria tosichella TaxID=561515 RepID=A0A6G1SPF0_9ACAR
MYYVNHNHHHQGQRKDTLGTMLLTSSILVVLLCIAPHFTSAQSLYSMAQKLKIPDVIPITGSTSTIKVELNGNVVKPGDAIPARNFKNFDVNKVTWDAEYDSKYTLMLLDLDRKSNTNATNIYNQYTNLNIPGNMVASGQVIVAFDLPNIPCQPSTKHRLVLLAFHQDQTLDLADIAYISASSGHSPRREMNKFDDFTSRHRLHLVAANVFQAIGEVNGVCSAATTVYPNIFSLSSIIVVMVMFKLALFNQH